MTQKNNPCTWLNAYPSHVPAQIPPVRGGLPQLLLNATHIYPWREYLLFLGQSHTYTEITERAHTFAAALQALNLPPQSRVALCLPNCPAYVVGFWGTLLAGHVVVNLNPLLTAAELAHELNDSQADVLLTFNLNPTFGNIYTAVRNSTVRHIWLTDLCEDMPPLTSLGFRLLKMAQRMRSLPPSGRQTWRWLSDRIFEAPPFRAVTLHSQDLALLQYTGGTTGTPKAAMLTHGNLLSNAKQVEVWLGKPLPAGETLIAVLPLFHVFALNAVLLLGTSVMGRLVLMPQFKLADLLKLITRYKPTLLPGVPTLFNALATHPSAAKTPMQSLRFCISGGAPLPAAVKAAFETRTGAVVVEGYGLTEASPVVACGPSVGQAAAGSVGYPLPSTRLEIRDPTAPFKLKPVGEIGEIWLQGPQVMQGYWRNPKASQAVLHKGWLRTGDVGHFDEHGALHVVDRIKELIIVNGYKVYPRHVEEVLAQHPAVLEAVVIGVPYPKTGEAPMAFVTLKPALKSPPHSAEVLEWANARLNKFSKLVAIEIREVLPKTLVGKLSRKALVAERRAKPRQSR